MSRTVIWCNPFGTDCTPWLNGSLGSWKLLKGKILQPGDTLYVLPYKNSSGIANVENGEDMFDSKVRSITSGDILAAGYSEGDQVLDKWITDNHAEGYASGRMSFLSIANANSMYGGFAYNHAAFDAVGFTGGLPTTTLPWSYHSFARQYDGIADFPTDPDIQAALVNLQVVANGTASALPAAVQKVAKVMNNTPKGLATNNAMWGAVYIHNWYFNVAPGDPGNTTYTDPANGAVYELAPTYPVPLLGTGITLTSKDTADRTQIETCFSRPMPVPVPQTKSWGRGWSST